VVVIERFLPIEPPREFAVGPGGAIVLRDCGRLALGADEQVTFVTSSGGEYDVVRKAWGFYATPSVNGRLPRFGLRTAIVRSRGGSAFVMLVEGAHQQEFTSYCEDQELRILAWLDDRATLDRLADRPDDRPDAIGRCVCDADAWIPTFTYTSPPPGEVRFAFSGSGPYRRTVFRCRRCGHFVSRHDLDASGLYRGDYVASTYGEDGLLAAFERITALDPARSDNAGRVARIQDFARAHFAGRPGPPAPSLLDVGSGLGVFVHGMKAAGWQCTALDPDPRAARHAREVVGVGALCTDFLQAEGLGRFDTVTFNKVLEHVADPAAMLAAAHRWLAAGGFVYLEVPDGEAAAGAGPDREEFFIDHRHVFSPASLALLAARASFAVCAIERLREPSGKYTLRAFVTAQAVMEAP
jgi:SAM-dependent methyltransferase